MGDVLMHQPPQSFDGIEMGAVSWQEAQHAFAFGPCQPLLDDDGAMIGGVVEKDMDAAHLGMRALDLLQELDQTRPIDPLDVQDLIGRSPD